jgi:hypothetical protein
MDYGNKEVVLEALKSNGYASEELKSNKEVVIHTIKSDGDVMRYASEDLIDSDYFIYEIFIMAYDNPV